MPESSLSFDDLIRSMDQLKKELMTLNPTDRLGYVHAIVQCLNAAFPSGVAVYQAFQDARQTSLLDLETLKSLFEKFQKISLERMEVNKEALTYIKRGERRVYPTRGEEPRASAGAAYG